MKLPHRLYKYKRLDEKTISLIVNSVVYFARADQFNDPFDCRFKYDLTGPEAEWKDFFATSLTEHHPEIPPHEVARMVGDKEREGAFRDRGSLEFLSEDALRAQNEGLGILCLTANPTNILMWSHYADSHKGCCLEFSAEARIFNTAKQVKYAVEYPKVRYLDCVDKPDIHAELTTLTKSDLWTYEEEWRVTCLQGPGLYRFDERSLTGIICGHWMTEENIALLKGLVKSRNPRVQLYRATPNDRQFAMKLVPLE